MTTLDDSAVQDSARRLLPIQRAPWAVERARSALKDRTVRLGFRDRARIDAEVLWEYGADRARGRHAHGFTFLTDWAGAGPLLPDSEASALSDLIVELFSAWEERFGDERITAPEMAFHDETTAQRMLGLVSVLDSLTFTNAQRETLTDLAHRTAALLAEPDFYGGVNNHGMFQDLAILAWAVLIAPADDPARTSAWDLAAQRLRDYFSSCFTSEGVHIENTPTYHVMVARYLPLLAELFTNADSPDAELYRQLHAGAARFAVHCVTPETLYPPVSDTHRRRLDTPDQSRDLHRRGVRVRCDRRSAGRAPPGVHGSVPRFRICHDPIRLGRSGRDLRALHERVQRRLPQALGRRQRVSPLREPRPPVRGGTLRLQLEGPLHQARLLLGGAQHADRRRHRDSPYRA